MVANHLKGDAHAGLREAHAPVFLILNQAHVEKALGGGGDCGRRMPCDTRHSSHRDLAFSAPSIIDCAQMVFVTLSKASPGFHWKGRSRWVCIPPTVAERINLCPCAVA